MKKLYTYLRALWLGLRLRCPNCGQGKMFRGLFEMEKTCPICHVRFERLSGESIGGFFLVDVLTDIPPIHQLLFWIPFTIVFCVLFYRHARAMWVAVAFLAGGVYTDEEEDRIKANKA